MAAVRHHEFGKISIFGHVTYICMSFVISIPNFALIGQKPIFNMASVRHLEFEKFRFFVKLPCSECKLASVNKIRSKLDNSQLDMEIKLFSKWRPSAILNLGKLPFWSCDQYLHEILHLLSKFRVDRPIRRRDIAKNDIQYGVRPPS